MWRCRKENRISINELLGEIRIQGVGDIRDIDYCILEQNGKISILKKSGAAGLVANPLIIDGELNKTELRLLEMTENEVLCRLGKTDVSDIFLMTLDENGELNIILKEEI